MDILLLFCLALVPTYILDRRASTRVIQTLPEYIRRLIAENPQEIRDALRKLREPGCNEVTIRLKNGRNQIIRKLHPD
jgi:hypothetical protein